MQLFYFSSFSEEMLNFVLENHDHRVKTKTLREYKDLPNKRVVVCIKANTSGIVALSASMIFDGKSKYSLTVTRKDERNIGHGTEVLSKKIDIIHSLGLKYETQIAEDNGPSLRIAEKSNHLHIIKTKTALRKNKTEEYKLVILGEDNDQVCSD